MASLLCHYLHIGNFYNAGEIANALKIEADIVGSGAINAGVDVALLLCAFANKGADEDVLPRNILCREGSREVLYVRRTTKHGRKREKIFSFFIGRFRSSNDAKMSKSSPLEPQDGCGS